MSWLKLLCYFYFHVMSFSFAQIPDKFEKVRLSKLKLFTVNNASLWLATPDWEAYKNYPGADWYQQVWNNHHFNDMQQIEIETTMTYLKRSSPTGHCLYIQFGSHLGVFNFVAAKVGCRTIAIDAYSPHHHFVKLSMQLNQISPVNFQTVWAAGASTHGGTVKFSSNRIVEGDSNEPGAVDVPTTSLDQLIEQHPIHKGENVYISLDTEGSETSIIEGGKRTIMSKKVKVFCIEVWHFRNSKAQDNGALSVLYDSGYEAFVYHNNKLTKQIPKSEMLSGHRRNIFCNVMNQYDNCLEDVYFLLPGLIKHFHHHH